MPIDWHEVTRYGGIPKVGRPPELSPAKGPIATERHKKKLAQARTKKEIREQVRELDGLRCRWPECSTDPETESGALECVHFEAEGAGGDPLLARFTLENLILLCHFHHRGGPRSLHTGLSRMEPLTEQGMRGAVMFLSKEDGDGGRWFVAGITSPPECK